MSIILQVVRQILSHFSNSQILELSRVNSVWNFAGRSLLRTRGKTVARIWGLSEGTLTRRACRTLSEFATLIGRTRALVPFAGFDIMIDHSHHGPCQPLNQESLLALVNAKVPIKNLSINNDSKYDLSEPRELRFCEALGFVQSIFCKNSHEIQKLSFEITHTSLPLGLKLAGREFPRLETVKVSVEQCGQEFESELDFLKDIVAGAKHLQQIHFHFISRHNDKVRESEDFLFFQDFLNAAVEGTRVSLFCKTCPFPDLPVMDDFAARLVVRSARLACFSYKDYVTAEKILENSAETLETAVVDVMMLLKILVDTVRLPRLRRICLEINLDYVEREHPALMNIIMTRQDLWKQSFPNLEELEINAVAAAAHHDEDDDDDYEPDPELMLELNKRLAHCASSSNFQQLEQQTWLEVKFLRLWSHWGSITAGLLDFLCQLCPNLKGLEVRGEILSLPFFWCHWRFLRNIEFESQQGIDLDSMLCGIHQDEAADLRGKDAEYLKAVHIVPIHPPITHHAGDVQMRGVMHY